MKKFIKNLLCLILLISSIILFPACSEKLTKIEVVNSENFEYIEYGGTINWNNLKLKATYSDGKILTYNYGEIKKELEIDLGEFKSTKPGEYEIYLNYKGETCSIKIEVREAIVSGIGIDRTNLPEVVNIEQITAEFKSNFTNKVLVKAYKTDGSSINLSQSEYSIVNYDFSTNTFADDLNLGCLNGVGEHWFAIKYGNFTPKTFMVKVKLGDENGFILGLEEINQNISIGEDVDFSKVKVYATYTDGRQILLNESEYLIDYSSFNNLVAGNYTITVSYKHYLNKSFNVQVSE